MEDKLTTIINARCSRKTLQTRLEAWTNLGILCQPGKPGMCSFAVKADAQYCKKLCNVLAEIGYDGVKIMSLWPELAVQAGLTTYANRRQLANANRIVDNSGEIKIVDEFVI